MFGQGVADESIFTTVSSLVSRNERAGLVSFQHVSWYRDAQLTGFIDGKL